jgi:RNA polymerase sigma-70 factor (ECF subfamily)
MSGPPAANDPVEDPLLARARRGDREAFEQLVGMHLPRVWRVVWRIVRHHEDCEDVVQEVFLTAWQGLPEYRGDARFSTWLHTIAVTRSLNYKDRAAEKLRRASSPLETDPDEGPAAAITREAERAGVQSPSPLQALEAGELRRRLAQCLDKLPPAWRAVLALRDGEELSYEDIARLLGLALGTVRSRLARARLGLRGCIEGTAS